MYSLFIDTHSELITVSFIKFGKEFTKSITSKSHSTVLLPLISEMLEAKKTELTDFNKVIVINGPGSFTGIRIGLSVAKTISWCLKIPIYTLSSLKAYLISNNYEENAMCVIPDSKGFYVGTKNDEKYEISLENYGEYKEVEKKLDVLKIEEYCQKIEPDNVHLVKANYVKIIEALK